MEKELAANKTGSGESVGETLERLRQECGLSVQQAAQAARISRATLHRWESNTFLPRREELNQLLSALNASVAQRRAVLEALPRPRAVAQVRELQERNAGNLPGYLPHSGHLWQALRERRGWNQAQVARSAGVSPSTVWRMERGDFQPTADLRATLFALLKAQSEERDVLSLRSPFLPSSTCRTSSDFERRVGEFRFAMYDGSGIAIDLCFLSLERDLWPLAQSGKPWGRHLLAVTYALHGDWLCNTARYRRAAECAGWAADVLPADGSVAFEERWRFDLVRQEASFILHGGKSTEAEARRQRANRAAAHYRSHLHRARHPAHRSMLHRDMADALRVAGENEEALHHLVAAERLAEEGDSVLDQIATRQIRVMALLEASKAREALALLEELPIEGGTFWPIRNNLHRAEALLALGDTNTADHYLRRFYDLTQHPDYALLRRQGDGLAKQMETR